MAQQLPRHVLITGTSRGLGLEMVRQFAAEPNVRVFAACRNPSKAEQLQQLTQRLPNVEVLEMDVSDEGSIRSAFSRLSSSISQLHLLVNNAAVQSPRQPFDLITTASLTDALTLYRTNVLGPLLITQLALPFLLPSTPSPSSSPTPPVVLNVSSTFGSVSLTTDGNDCTYKMSKAALNQQTRAWAGEVKGVVFVAISPGWVATDMGSKGGRHPPLTVEQSVAGMKRVADGLRWEDTGSFLSWDGHTVPW